MDASGISIHSIPLRLWKQIFIHCYYSKNNGKRYRIKREDAIFVWFVALKSTSKQLNLLLDDKFFLEVTDHYALNLRRVFTHKKLLYLVKKGSYVYFKANFQFKSALHRASAEKLAVSRPELLALIAQYSDPDFLTDFLNDKQEHFTFDNQSLLLALRCANERKTNDMTIALFPHFFKLCHLKVFDENVVTEIVEALRAGKILNFDAAIGFDEFVMHTSQSWPWNDASSILLDLISNTEATKPTMLIPTGELIRFKCWDCKGTFTRGLTNVWVQDMKPKQCAIVYRKRNSKQNHRISIKKEITANGVTYSYDNITTSNLYELIVKSSLADQLFSTFPHTYVAVTKEALELPLDEQPWFVGCISDDNRRELATDALNMSSFFTYCSVAGEIKLQWTETAESRKLRFMNFRTIQLQDKDVSECIPNDRIVFGISNGGYTKAIADYMAVKCAQEGNFEKLKKCVADNETNLLHMCVAREVIHEDMLLWLMNNGASIETASSGTELSFTQTRIVENCSEFLIQKMLEITRKCSAPLIDLLLQRRVSFGLLKLALHSPVDKVSPNSIISSICSAIGTKKVKYEDYTKRVLVKTAWKFGNEDNYFKLLPKELIDQILSYEDIDVPLYYELFLILSKQSWGLPVIDTAMEPFMKFFLKYCGQVFTSTKALELAGIIASGDFSNEETAPKLTYWFRRILRSEKLGPKPIALDPSFAKSPLVRYSMQHSTADALFTLKFILERKLAKKEDLTGHLGCVVSHDGRDVFMPLTWLAVHNNNKAAIKLLIDEDLLPDTSTWHGKVLQLSNIKQDPATKEYVEQCRQEKLFKQ